MDPRTVWQTEAIDEFLRAKFDFLVTACPGAGKTRFALGSATELMRAGTVERIIVIVPTDQLRQQWRDEAHERYNLDLTATFKNGDGSFDYATHGAVATYSQVANAAELWRLHASRKPTIVIFDEIHHAGDQEHSSWGPAIRRAFEVAERRLLLSGTPFRTDGSRIPFVDYDDNGISISHAGVSYREGVRKSIVRPIRFEVHDGIAEWVEGGLRSDVRLSESDDKTTSAALRTVYQPENDWLPSILIKADHELTRARYEMPDAGGLILAPTKAHADQYAALMQGICREPVSVVYSEMDADPSGVIERFRKGDSRWLVAVAMVSEGVDIPRLAVGVYASNKTTELWFRQVVGRFIRMRSAEDTLTATLMIPATPNLSELARRIEDEARVALEEAVREARESGESEPRQVSMNLVEPLSASESMLSEVLMSGTDVPDVEITVAERLKMEIGRSLAGVHAADLALALRVHSGVPRGTVKVDMPSAPKVSPDKHRKALRRQLSHMVNMYCRDFDVEQKSVNYRLKQMFGGPVDQASVDNLQKRIDYMREMGA